MTLAQVVALVGLGVLLGGFAATRGVAHQVNTQMSTSTGVFTVGERIEIRPVAGFANQDCTVVRVSNSFLQCKERPLDWWNTQQIVLVVRK